MLMNRRPSSKKEMQKFLAEEWGNISTEVTSKFVESMPLQWKMTKLFLSV